MNPATLVRVAIGLFFLGYPFIVYFGLKYLPPSFFGIVLMVLLGVRFGVLDPKERRILLPVLLLLVGYAVATAILDSTAMLLLYPALVNFVLSIVFANSLRSEEPLLLRIVRARGVAISIHTPRYLFRLTALWAGFFMLNGLVSLWTSTLTMNAWILYNGFIAYIAIATLGGGELLFRRYYKKRLGISST